jgi:hypothetical protein
MLSVIPAALSKRTTPSMAIPSAPPFGPLIVCDSNAEAAGASGTNMVTVWAAVEFGSGKNVEKGA